MLGWLAKQYPELKIVWIVRDPVSVIHSQLLKIQRGWQFGWQPEFVLSQPDLMQQHLQPFQARIESASTVIEQLAYKWCIETLVPLTECAECENVLRIDYAKLTKSEQCWQQLVRFLQPVGWLDAAAKQASGQISFISVESRGDNSSTALQPNDIKIIEQIVAEFALDQYAGSPSGKAEMFAT